MLGHTKTIFKNVVGNSISNMMHNDVFLANCGLYSWFSIVTFHNVLFYFYVLT